MSKATKIEQARLRQHVFLYLAGCIRARQNRALRALSIRPDQVRRIAELRTSELLELGETSGPSILFDIDPDVLDRVFVSLKAKKARERLIERCLRRDAPRAMMQRCFGISRQRYARIKRELDIAERRGRSRLPSETTRDEIHRLWDESKIPRTAATLLSIAEHLEISLRTVWGQLANELDEAKQCRDTQERHRRPAPATA